MHRAPGMGTCRRVYKWKTASICTPNSPHRFEAGTHSTLLVVDFGGVLDVILKAFHRASKLANPLADTLSQLWQLLRAKKDEYYEEN